MKIRVFQIDHEKDEKNLAFRDYQTALVLLSTCSYEFDNARTVLTGRLVEMEGDVNA